MTTRPRARGRVRVEQGGKRIRAYLAGELVADTTRPLLVWEKPYYPTYYFPAADVRTDLLSEDGGIAHSPSRGDAKIFTVTAGGHDEPAQRSLRAFTVRRAAATRSGSSGARWTPGSKKTKRSSPTRATRTRASTSSPALGTSASRSTASRSPNRRSRRSSSRPASRPATTCRRPTCAWICSRRTTTSSHCPYKGQANYWSLTLGDAVVTDVAWSYRTPLPESQKIAGLVSFYPEKVDLYVDGRLQE